MNSLKAGHGVPSHQRHASLGTIYDVQTSKWRWVHAINQVADYDRLADWWTLAHF